MFASYYYPFYRSSPMFVPYYQVPVYNYPAYNVNAFQSQMSDQRVVNTGIANDISQVSNQVGIY